MDRTERFYRIGQLLAARRVVPIATFLAELEVSRATFTRDIEYMRERLNVPIEWDRRERGYRLAEGAGVELPGLWLNADEIRALLVMEQLVQSLQSDLLGPLLSPIRDRLAAFASAHGQSVRNLQERVRVIGSQPRAIDSTLLRAVLAATLDRRRVRVEHFHRLRNETVVRELSPQSIVFYRNAWYLQAWCHMRSELRVFALDAIRDAELTHEPALDMDPQQVRARLDATYGIFDSAAVRWARIRFSPAQARWVASELWHPQQKGTLLEDGSYEIELPYGVETELLMDVMRFGPEAEVLEPAELRQAAGALLERAAALYRGRG